MQFRLNIRSKLILSLGLVVVVGFSALIAEQWLALKSGITSLESKNRNAIGTLLAQNISGGLKWKKAVVIEKVYAQYVDSTDTQVASLITLDTDGALVTSFTHETLKPYDLASESGRIVSQMVDEELHWELSEEHSIMSRKVINAKGQHVGYLMIAYSDAVLTEFVINRSIIATLISLAAIAFILLSLWAAVHFIFSRPMRILLETARELADGDGNLTRRIDIKSKDELGELSESINLFLEKLHSTIGKVVETAGKVRLSLDDAREKAGENEGLLDQQSSELGMVNQSLIAMSGRLDRMSDSAQGLAKYTAEANTIAQNADSLADQAVVSVRGLTLRVQASGESVSELKQRSENIGVVLSVIRGIAEQINLLALNAAIEAARAGEQGRGFAVVADEVRTLASRTQQSTEEIHQIIESLQNGAQRAVTTMEQSQEDVTTSAEHIQQVKVLIEEIHKAMAGISQTNSEVAAEVDEQSSEARELSGKISRVSDLSVTVLANGRSTSQSCELLSQVNENLNSQVSYFKV
ncbi:MAG: methyl-accepting chemotaxis protein [Gammaproteobacteria bacterium]|jgi:methyl-accepting chemotaxis protein